MKSSLGKSFERVEIEAFSRGSIIVDYYVVFKELEQKITTQDLKDTVDIETKQADNSNMLGSTNLRIDPKYSDFIGRIDVFSQVNLNFCNSRVKFILFEPI